MTEDEQEALSCKYVMPRCMRLASGNYAMFIGEELRIIISDSELIEAMPVYAQLPEARKPEASPRRKTLNLADLGL